MRGRRSQARRYAVLAVYQWQLTGHDPADIGRHFFEDPAWITEVAESLADVGEEGIAADALATAYDRAFFDELLSGVPEYQEELDERLRPALDRPIARVDPVERAILRVGAYELLYCPQVPARAVINEAVDLAKLLGAEQGHRYVNGVLDRLAREVRAAELAGGKGAGAKPGRS
jgi:N utilization substance protein B